MDIITEHSVILQRKRIVLEYSSRHNAQTCILEISKTEKMQVDPSWFTSSWCSLGVCKYCSHLSLQIFWKQTRKNAGDLTSSSQRQVTSCTE